ncbi:MAG: hypothetical protein JNM43_09835 [Planctomycetaceae bacterium]|nr:hypothetical protein [Planctomycetaceae bacterium]
MSDLQSKSLIVFKGLLFLLMAVMSAVILFAQAPTITTATLLGLLIWSSCRFYYFLFYVLEKYVDPTMRYAGLIDLIQGMKKRRNGRDSGSECR